MFDNNYSNYFTSLTPRPKPIVQQYNTPTQELPMIYTSNIPRENTDFNFTDFVQSIYSFLPFLSINQSVLQNSYSQQPQQKQQQQQTPVIPQTTKKYDQSLRYKDIEDLLKEEGFYYINGKKIKYGNSGLRPKGSKYGVPNSWHYKLDPDTGKACARDISIENGSVKDYEEFKRRLVSNQRVRDWMEIKNWGILNELTPEIMKSTNATGPHLHSGKDAAAVRTWKAWLEDITIPVTKIIRKR